MGGVRKTAQELCFLVTANVLGAHFKASVNSPPRLDRGTHHLSIAPVPSPTRRHPQLATILEHHQIKSIRKWENKKEIEVIRCFSCSWRFRGHLVIWPLVTLPVYLGPICGSGHGRKVSRLRLWSLDKQEWHESGKMESAGRLEWAPPSQRFLGSEFQKNTKFWRSFQKVAFCYESSKYKIKKACLASSSFIDF